MSGPDRPRPVRASTPGPDSLGVAVWNVGMATERSFARDYDEALAEVAEGICKILVHSHVVGLNEVHTSHFANIAKMLTARDPKIQFLGLETMGDAVAWRSAIQERGVG